ncbi:ankyrin repeat domain-containing protein 6-like isoform X4 [Ptychodera flava]|uniref:ankyrin repeat domain-containing protein 6-like isoform X4 n=1 Tax=Ptychodera flava TaxID=63121 RepID=UPI003969C26E
MSTPGGGQLSDKLRLAASKGQTARIKELLESGATFEPDKNSRTAVHYAALNGHATTIKACIQQGCEPDIQDVAGRSPMHLAVTDGHVEAVRALIEEGCPVDRQDQVNGNTALHEAAWNGYSKSVEVLVGYGRANVHAANRSGMRPLHMAVQNGHNESARVLLRNGTHPDTRNNHGETPLHIGATHGHVTCCRILISAKCDINAVNKDGNTPLHVAASLGKRKITKILVEAGCDVNIKNNKGQTAIDVARDHEYPEVIIIMTSTPKAQTSRSRRHHRNHPTEYQTPVMGRREQRARAAEQGMMGAQAASANPTSRGHGPGAFSATDGPRSGFGPPWQQQSGMSWQQQAWNQWSWQRQQEQQYQNLQGQRQTPLERAMDLERQTHQNVQLGRITGNPHQHSEYYRDAFGSVHERPISNCNCMPYVRDWKISWKPQRRNLCMTLNPQLR